MNEIRNIYSLPFILSMNESSYSPLNWHLLLNFNLIYIILSKTRFIVLFSMI